MNSSVPATIYEIVDQLGVCTCFFNFGDRMILVGPYVQSEYSETKTEQILIKNNVPSSSTIALRLYYTSFPIIYSSQLQALISSIMQSFEPGILDYNYRKLSGFIQESSDISHGALPENTDFSDIYRRYDNEKRFLSMIKNGDVENVKQAYSAMANIKANEEFMKDNPTYAKPEISFAIIRVLARKAAEESGLSVITINAITQKYVQLLDSVKEAIMQHSYIEDMIVELTSAVHEYKLSMGDYSAPIQKVIEYIDFHLSEEILIDDLSRAANVSGSHLSKVFKKETGRTITEYIAGKRCEKAAGFLRDTDNEIQEISSFVGYSDNNYFVKVFKKVYGMTPSGYRKKNRAATLTKGTVTVS
jgi:AraC-like DNA-binding protein